MNIGERAGAIFSADSRVVNLFGYGSRIADEVPTGACGIGKRLAEAKIGNPCILLDSGKKVYGCECWWTSEGKVKEMIGDREVVEIDIDKIRAGAQS